MKQKIKKQYFYPLKIFFINFAVCCQHIIAVLMIPATHQHLRRSDGGDTQSFCMDFLCKMLKFKHCSLQKKDISSHPNFKYTKQKKY